MVTRKEFLILLAVSLIVLGSDYIFFKLDPATPVAKTTVVYTDNGYQPQTIIIHTGDTVTWENKSSKDIWTTSGPHEDHSDYSGTPESVHCPDLLNVSFDECKEAGPGSLWSFTFLKTGTWKYHNHVYDDHTGIVIVK